MGGRLGRPVPEDAAAGITAVSVSDRSSAFLALTDDGHAVDWAPDSTHPSRVRTAATGLVAIAAGDGFSAAQAASISEPRTSTGLPVSVARC